MDEDGSRSASCYFPGEGEMVRAVCEKDWSTTVLGPVSGWPASIRTAVGIGLNSNFQIMVLSGPELVYIYNDAAVPIFGAKHPWALGRPVAEVWPEIWATVGPMLNSVLATGKATRQDDLRLVLNRGGFTEECYFTLSYSPIRGDAHTPDGVFVTTMETTRRVLAERRQRTVNDLATQVAVRRGDEQTVGRVRQALAANLHDVPLAALYLAEPDAGYAAQVFCTGPRPGRFGIATRIAWSGAAGEPGEHPLARLARSSEAQVYATDELLGEAGPCGVWPDAPRQLLALPFMAPGLALPRGFLVVALNPRAPLDADYRQFIDNVAGLVATAVAGIDAIAADRRRAEAMAELDRSKSQFFANASHELRTPVTLILGPLAELLERPGTSLAPGVRDYIELAHRNAQRLHKLVNAIMDFASIEAGGLPMVLEPVDIGALTAEVASLFRSAIEAAGLTLSVRSSLPPGAVAIDREMWEKVVLNLVSNAYKFTPAGRIELELARGAGMFTLTVRDTGIGIADDELERVFERFYRSGRLDGRQVQGSGIGLALVRELVRLHGGNVEVRSTPGRGSSFTVTLPWQPVAARTPRAAPAPPRAQRYPNGLADPEGAAPPAAVPAPAGRIRVVVVDDHADIVHYIGRLLEDFCIVESAHDAASGLAAVRAFNPDLVLVDVMMPGTDGLELVRAIRADPAIHTVSVIVLSARAGGDARLDALAAGADEYLGKPFSGRELVARVSSNVRMARIRRAAIEQELELRRQINEVRTDLASVLEGTSDAFLSLDVELHLLALNEAAAADLGAPIHELLGRKLTEVGATLIGGEVEAAMRSALARRLPLTLERFDAARRRWFNVRCFPAAHGLIVFATDITERKEAEQMLVEAKSELERRVEARTEELRQANGLLNVLYLRLQTVREEERTALAREVHDQLGQTLSAAKIDLKLLEDDFRRHGAALAGAKILTELQSACATLDRAMQLVREIATELRAPELDGQGLYAAIDWHARDFERRTRIAIHLELGARLEQPARPAAEALLRIFREAMTNVLRHAHAANVWVSIERRGGALLLRVRDDGAGIARRRARTGRSLGITGMHERAVLAGGRLTVGPVRPQGTLVSALIPMNRTGPDQGGLA